MNVSSSSERVPRRSVRRVLAMIFVVLAMSGAPTSSGAQSSDRLDELKEERRRAQEDAAAQASQVDAATAEVDELATALRALQTQVNAAQGRLDEAQRNLADAEARLDAAATAVAEQQAGIEALKVRLAERAVESFVNQGDDGNIIARSADPSEAVRMQALVANVTQSEADVVEALKSAEEDLRIQQQLADEAAIEASAHRDSVATELSGLESARSAQAELTEQAEIRLDEELHELAAIKDLDAELAAEYEAESNRLAEELARKAVAPRPSGGGGGGGPTGAPVGADEIVSVRGIRVHQSIAGKVEDMLAAASADGDRLAGSGYRSSDAQIAVRRSNCGTSEYAIWQMPPSQCSPPTARPGSSQHERGLAIDFTYNGSLIRSRSNDGFKWLAANAASYGLHNLPSEPWHWSTNGS